MRTLTLACALLATLAAPAWAGSNPANIVINELDADQTGTDSVEFIELATSGGGTTDLTGYFLVLYNGSNDLEYSTVSLAGQTMPGDGFFVVGVAIAPHVDFTPSNWAATNAIQNGQDAAALYYDPTGLVLNTDFFGTVVGSQPAGVVLVDAVVYDTSDADDAVLLAALTPGQPQVDENGNLNGTLVSIQRCPDAGAPFDTGSYVLAAPTAGLPNACLTNAWSDQGSALAGAAGDPLLVGTGDLSDGSNNSVDLSNAAPSAVCGLFLALTDNPTAFKGGTLRPIPTIIPVLILNTDGSGAIALPFVMPSGVPAGTEIWVQYAIQDAGAVQGVALSNAVMGLTP